MSVAIGAAGTLASRLIGNRSKDRSFRTIKRKGAEQNLSWQAAPFTPLDKRVIQRFAARLDLEG